MNNDKPTILDSVLFFVLIFIFVVCTITLIQSGIVSALSLLGSCK